MGCQGCWDSRSDGSVVGCLGVVVVGIMEVGEEIRWPNSRLLVVAVIGSYHGSGLAH